MTSNASRKVLVMKVTWRASVFVEGMEGRGRKVYLVVSLFIRQNSLDID